MSSNEERARILRLVAAGNITPAEAEDLLAALEPPRPSEGRAPGTSGNLVPRGGPPLPPARAMARRSLVIQIADGGETKVNVRIPLSLARAARKFIPRSAQASLENYDIKLEDLLSSLDGFEEGGTLVEIRDGEDKVRIAVE